MSDSLLLSSHCGSRKKCLLRPGGSKVKPKRFIAKSAHERVSCKKKIGNRISYSIKELLSFKSQYRLLFSLNCETIENVFEEGLGIDDIQLDLLINVSNINDKTKNKSKTTVQSLTLSERDDICNSSSNSSGGSSSTEDNSLSPSKCKSKCCHTKCISRRPSPLKIFRGKVVLLLSKVTISNFTTIKRQLIEVFVNEANKLEELKLLVSIIFNKIVNEQQYAALYAQLCVELSHKEKHFTVAENDTRLILGFKNVLIQQCQVEFEKCIEPAKIDENSTVEDIRLAEVKHKRILMGTIKFIGQLYNYQLLRSNIITHCLNELMFKKGSEIDIDIEAAIGLLETVGKQLDTECLNVISSYYDKLESIYNNSKRYNPRIRILVLNLLDYRRNGWKSRTKSIQAMDEMRKENGIASEANASLLEEEVQEAIDSYMRTIQYADHVDFTGENGMNNQEDINMKAMHAMSGINLTMNLNGAGAGLGKYIKTRCGRRRYTTMTGNQLQGGNQMANRQQISGIGKRNSNEKSSHPQHRFLMKSKNVGFDIVSYDYNDDETHDCCSDDIELSDEKRDMLLDEYFISTKSKSQFLTAISNFKFNHNKFLDELLRKALDRSYFEQESASRLIVTMYKENYLSLQEICQCVEEYFEYYTMEIVDIPTLAKEISNILSILMNENIVSMSNIKEWLTKDPRMLKRPFRRRGDPDLTFAHEFLAVLFTTIRDRDFDAIDYVELMFGHEGNFNLDCYFKNNQIRQKWDQQWVSCFLTFRIYMLFVFLFFVFFCLILSMFCVHVLKYRI